jgi:LacI family transcriptional regulator
MTIKDIARESGYSVGTVSRVLNQSDGVSERARKTIMEVVEKHHFQLNNNAKKFKKAEHGWHCDHYQGNTEYAVRIHC